MQLNSFFDNGSMIRSETRQFQFKTFLVTCVMYIYVGKEEWQICLYGYSYGTLKSPPFQS